MIFSEFLNVLNEAEKQFIVKVTDLESKRVEYVCALRSNIFSSLTWDISKAIPVTKSDWESCVLKEKLESEKYTKRWYNDSRKYRCALIKYVPNTEDLIDIYYQPDNKEFTLTDVKKAFKQAGVNIVVTERDRYSVQYSREFTYYYILKINQNDVKKAETVVQHLAKSVADIGFARPDRRTSASEKLTFN